MILDLGTGDGRAVLRRARREPAALVIGADADAAAMREASARAARGPKKGGLPNALYLAAAAEAMPGPLEGKLDLLTVTLPWGSLLRGLARPDPCLLAALAGSLRPDGEVELLLSVQPADRSLGLEVLDGPAIDGLVDAYAAVGLCAKETRPATREDVARLGSSWARRLGVPARRPAWLLRFRRVVEPSTGTGASTAADEVITSHACSPALEEEITDDPQRLSAPALVDDRRAGKRARGLRPDGRHGSHSDAWRGRHKSRPPRAGRRGRQRP